MTRAPAGLCPEQIVALTSADSAAALVDPFGRAHPLEDPTVVGRDPEEVTLAVLEASISRRHAELRRGGAGWQVRDLGSTNGTFVDRERAEGDVPVADGQRLTFGHVSFVFVGDARSLAARHVTESIRRTATHALPAPPAGLALAAPSGGGGGVLQVGSQALKLGVAAAELVRVLATRRAAEADLADDVRGFVRSSELLAVLPWDTPHPDENHLKQLVRRVRRALDKVGAAEVVESRHGFGYRVRVDVGAG